MSRDVPLWVPLWIKIFMAFLLGVNAWICTSLAFHSSTISEATTGGWLGGIFTCLVFVLFTQIIAPKEKS